MSKNTRVSLGKFSLIQTGENEYGLILSVFGDGWGEIARVHSFATVKGGIITRYKNAKITNKQIRELVSKFVNAEMKILTDEIIAKIKSEKPE